MHKEEFDAILERDTGPIEDHLGTLATERDLPAAALGVCLARIEEAGPLLINLLDNAANGMELSEDQSELLFRGLHVLGGARYQACFPSLLACLRLPEDRLLDLLGDATTVTLPKIVIGTFNGDAAALFDLILTHPLDEFVCSGLLLSAAYLTWEGRIERLALEAMLTEFYQQKRYEDGSFAWYGWQMSIAVLALHELVPLAAAAEADEFIPDYIADDEYVAEAFEEAETDPANPRRFEREGLGYLTDVYKELVHFNAPAPPRYPVPAIGDEEDEDMVTPPPWMPKTPVINPFRDIGRNDPCPCGSGKKYKKCCLGKN